MMRVLAAASAVFLLTSELSSQQSAPEWSLVPELRIGAVDGPDALDVVGPIVVSPRTGAVFVGERSQRILAFGADGRKLGSFGRRGPGPGEFENLIGLYWSGGLLVATDGRTRRVTRLTEDGEVVDSRLIESGALPGAPRRAWAVAPFGKTHFLGEMGQDVPAGNLIRGEDWLVRTDGASGDVILDKITRGLWIRMSSGSGIMFPVPMIPNSLYGVHPQGAAIAIVHQYSPSDDDTGHFRVRKVASDGKVIFARNYAYPPRPLPRGYVGAFIESRRSVLQRVGGSEREAERLISGRVPRFEPPITEVRVGADGSIWLRREAHEAEHVWWWVLDGRGDLVGRLRLPARLRIRHIDRETVWGIEYDDLDVNYVVKYRIQR